MPKKITNDSDRSARDRGYRVEPEEAGSMKNKTIATLLDFNHQGVSMKRLMVRCSVCKWRGQRVRPDKCPQCAGPLIAAKPMNPDQRSAVSRRTGLSAGTRFKAQPGKGRACRNST